MTQNEVLPDFLNTLYGDIAKGRVSVWWRSSPGSKASYDRQAWFDVQDQRDQMLAFIESVKDHDVCVTTATYSTDRRIPEFVEATHALWMDSDVCSGEKYRITPTWSVATSSGRWQHFWALSEEVTALRASELVHRISIAHDDDGADQSSWPSNKIMRVPGTMNTSHGFPTVVKATTNGLIYDIAEIENAYKDVIIPDRAAVREIPNIHLNELPNYGNTLAKLPSDLMELVTSEVKDGQDRSRLRYKMLLELFRASLSYEEVLSVSWYAPASAKWREEDTRGLAGLAAEAMKAQIEAGQPRAEPHDPYAGDSDGENELPLDKPVVLLTDEERLIASQAGNFISYYEAYAAGRLNHENRAYDRISAWTILSLAYMDSGYIPFKNRRGYLNFYCMILGETTSGKSSSFWLMKNVVREYFHLDPEFNIGGNASETALVKTLHGRDGKVSLFNSDEASGVLKVWVGQDWTSGIRERITELYDGEVNPLLRSGKGESVVKTSKALLDVYLAGTQQGIMEYMTKKLFEDGFIPRFIFGIGQPPHLDRSSYDIDLEDEEATISGFDPVARQMAAALASNAEAVRKLNGGEESPITWTPEAKARLGAAGWALNQEFSQHPMWEMIRPSIFRWQNNVHKAAALLAMDRRDNVVNLTDMLQAIEAGEEWLTNLLRVISRLNANAFERACTDIQQFVDSKGGRVMKTTVFRKFKQYPDYEMQGFIRSLANQHRVWENGKEGGREYFYSPLWREDTK